MFYVGLRCGEWSTPSSRLNRSRLWAWQSRLREVAVSVWIVLSYRTGWSRRSFRHEGPSTVRMTDPVPASVSVKSCCIVFRRSPSWSIGAWFRFDKSPGERRAERRHWALPKLQAACDWSQIMLCHAPGIEVVAAVAGLQTEQGVGGHEAALQVGQRAMP